jgi:predicted Zn-dependent protease
MSIRRQALVLSFLAIFAQQASAVDAQVVSTLVDQGKYWQSRSRADLAAESWKKLLQLDPGQPDALYGLGMGELDKNNGEAARRWLGKLKGAQAGHPFVALLEAAIATRSGAAMQIDAIRQLAQSGKSDAAIQRYRAMFGNQPPSGVIALEYYQTLGGTPTGWDEARDGLTRLEKENPTDARYALALAQHLSYRAATRADAIARLSELAGRAEVAEPATSAWRQALAWMTPRKSDSALYETYLKEHTDDAVIRAKLKLMMAKVQGPSRAELARRQLGQDLQQGFEMLDNGALKTAAQQFETILKKNPAEPRALGGLGVIRLRQQRFADAQSLLERASKLGQASQWRSALVSASYWSLLQKANPARQSGDLVLAQKLIEQAIALDPRDATAQIALAEVRAELKQYAAAEQLLRDVLAREPQQNAAIAAYADLLVKQDKFEPAIQMLERLTPQQRAEFGGVGQIQAKSLVKIAAKRQASGDLVGARTALEDALALNPVSPWTRLDLGRLYFKTGQANAARSVIDGLLLDGPEQPDALYAAALLYEESGDWNGSLQALGQVPAAARTQAMASVHMRVQLQIQVQQALGLARQGQTGEASAVLRQAEQSARSDEQIGTLASAYAQIGNALRALALMRPLLAKGEADNTGMLLQYAAVLLNTRQDAEFAGVLRQVQARNLTAQQAEIYADLRAGYLLRQADLIRESGDLATAFDVMAPLMAERPNDPRVLSTLARMYSADNQPGAALQLYERALASTPNDFELVLSATGAAVDAKAFDDAQALAERATRLEANNPRVLTAWARLYRAQGKNSKAEEFYLAALAAENTGSASLLAARPELDNNPFRRNASNAPLQPATSSVFAIAAPMPTAALPAALVADTYLPVAAAQSTYLAPAPRVATAASTAASPAAYLPVAAAQGSYLPPAPRPALASPVPDTRSGILPLRSGADSRLPYTSRVLPESTPSTQPSRATLAPASALRREAAEFAQQRSSKIEGQINARTHSGEAGLGQLTDVQSTIEGRIRAGDGHLTVSATPVSLDAGKLSPNYNTASRFGSGPVAALANTNSGDSGVQTQSAAGVGLAFGYDSTNWQADIGSTPFGFQYTNAVGGAHLSIALSDQTKLGIGVSRRAVTESLLSFAGTRDNRTGLEWGGVTANGARADLGWDTQGYGLYAYGQAQSLQGKNVASNTALQAGAGLYLDLYRDANVTVSSGLSTTIMAYDKNLSHLTYGNGGYFSPQTFFAMSLPLNFTGTNGRFGYQLRTSVGLQHFRQDDAPYFPTNALMQANAVTAAAAAAALDSNNNNLATFAGSTRTALAYNLGGALEYQLSPQVTLGV